jgi:hypothetical protein
MRIRGRLLFMDQLLFEAGLFTLRFPAEVRISILPVVIRPLVLMTIMTNPHGIIHQ